MVTVSARRGMLSSLSRPDPPLSWIDKRAFCLHCKLLQLLAHTQIQPSRSKGRFMPSGGGPSTAWLAAFKQCVAVHQSIKKCFLLPTFIESCATKRLMFLGPSFLSPIILSPTVASFALYVCWPFYKTSTEHDIAASARMM